MSIDKLSRDAVETERFSELDDAPTAATITTTAAVGDRCTNCHSQLAPDQRYCVNCGERRGRARFDVAALARPALAASAATESAGSPFDRGRRFRVTNGTTLVAFVATLLVAVGLGVLIGHDSSSPAGAPVAASTQPVNVTVNGGGSSVGATSAGGTSSTSSASSGSTAGSGGTGSAKSSAKSPAPPSAATQQKASVATNKALGGGNTKLAGSTVKQGGKCSGGAGCQGGKFTGNFFGGG
jgi:hypothetical protein